MTNPIKAVLAESVLVERDWEKAKRTNSMIFCTLL